MFVVVGGEYIDLKSKHKSEGKQDAARKREQLQQSQQKAPVNQLDPFEMSKKFYNMMEADISQVFS